MLTGEPPAAIAAPRDPESMYVPMPVPVPRPALPAPLVPVKRAQLPDAVVVSVIDAARPALAACVRRARARDASVGAVKLDLRLEIDRDGTVTGASLTLEDVLLQRCVLSIARGLRFPAPGQPAAAALAFIAS